MTNNQNLQNSNEVRKQFQNLLQKFQSEEGMIETKAKHAEQDRNKEIVEKSSGYTVEGIVKGLADLQLEVGETLESLSGKLKDESTKLDELKRAITVENEHLVDVRNVKIAAEALEILKKENNERRKEFDDRKADAFTSLEKETKESRELWAKEAQEFAEFKEEEAARVTKERSREEESFNYEEQKKRKVEMDKFEEKKRNQELSIKEQSERKSKDWKERSEFLAENSDKIAEMKEKVASFPEKLKEETTKARQDAIKKIKREAELEAKLREKESETNMEVSALRIQSLEETIEQNNQQIEKLREQLNMALNQVQSLAFKAIQGNSGQ